jgi:hypothetical protein
MNPIINVMLELPFDELDEFISGQNGWFQILSDEASKTSVKLALLSEYLGCRGGYGCGDQGHEYALKQAKERARKVRKTLGHTQP